MQRSDVWPSQWSQINTTRSVGANMRLCSALEHLALTFDEAIHTEPAWLGDDGIADTARYFFHFSLSTDP